MEKLIQIKNLTKCFGETKVLDKINVNFDRGHIYGIIGRNGSGKSMLMKCICGLVVPTSGEIIIDNKKLGTDIDLPENLAGIIEEPGFLENYSAYKNLQFLSMIKNIRYPLLHALSYTICFLSISLFSVLPIFVTYQFRNIS